MNDIVDVWKKQLTEDAHEYFNKDKRETRENISIENLLETDLVCEVSVEEEYLRAEEERQGSAIHRNVLQLCGDQTAP